VCAGPSFELFYENDYLMPHREAAWALLEERIREAANFCGLIQEVASDRVRSELVPVEEALTDIADSLAAHFADWGATSRFAAERAGAKDGAGETSEPHDSGAPLGFDGHIKPLFRERDRKSMQFAFDLWSEADVSAHADEILQRLEQGTMPCDGAWPSERVAIFRRWMEAAKQGRG
jgi:hypothetical protein